LNWISKLFFQKSQISGFGKYLNLFEFKNVFDLNINFGFKFKTVDKKFQKLFLFFRRPKSVLAQTLLKPGPSFLPHQPSFIWPISVQFGPPLLPVQVVAQAAHFSLSAQPRPAPSSPSFDRRPSRRHLLSLLPLPPPHHPPSSEKSTRSIRLIASPPRRRPSFGNDRLASTHYWPPLMAPLSLSVRPSSVLPGAYKSYPEDP
jgi:hypothetical protein